MTIRHRDHHARQNERMKEQIKEIVANHSEGIQILGLVANEYLTPEIFTALMTAKAYIGDTAVCAKKVQEVYKAIAKQNQIVQVPSAQDSSEPNVPQRYYFVRKQSERVVCKGDLLKAKVKERERKRDKEEFIEVYWMCGLALGWSGGS